MVYFMENPIKMDDFGGYTPIYGNPHILYHKIAMMVYVLW